MTNLTVPPGNRVNLPPNLRTISVSPKEKDSCPALRVEVGRRNQWEAVVVATDHPTTISPAGIILRVENLGDVDLIVNYTAPPQELHRAFPVIGPKSFTLSPATPSDAHVPEALPEHIMAKLKAKQDRLKNTELPDNVAQLVLNNFARWNTGVLTVSFKGGTSNLHRQIAEVARQWSQYGNIQFDFGESAPEGPYRQWVPGDRSNIRIGFDQPGYWSMVGTQSMDGSLMESGEISMNFQDFLYGLPYNWEKVVLHEFGHALGFEHEHQSPESTCDFDWEYIYQYYATTQGWSRSTTSANMALLINNNNQFTATPYDTQSIMHYSLPRDFFFSKERSTCYVAFEATQLSESDKALMAEVYPFDGSVEFQRDLAKMPTLRHLATHRELSAAEKDHYRSHMEFKAKRLMNYLERACTYDDPVSAMETSEYEHYPAHVEKP